MKPTQVYEWHKSFRDGRASVNDDPRCGRPSTSTNDEDIERVRNVVRSDRGKSIQEISAEVGISVVRVRSILYEDS
jgi:transposase